MSAVGAELALWQGRPEEGAKLVREALEWAERVGGQWVLVNIRLGTLGASLYAELAERAARRKDEAERQAAVEEGTRLVELARKTAQYGRPRTGALGPEGTRVARPRRGRGEPADGARATPRCGRRRSRRSATARCTSRRCAGGGSVRRCSAPTAATRRRRCCVPPTRSRPGWTPARCGTRCASWPAAAASRSTDGPAPRETLDPFTPRERSVLRLVALGRTNRQVGDELFISEKTVSVHLSRIMAKLGATRRAEAVAIAYDRGLLEEQTRLSELSVARSRVPSA